MNAISRAHTDFTDDVYLTRFLSASLPLGASIWYHSFDGSWWLGKVKQSPNDSGRYVIRFLDKPGPVLIALPDRFITRPCMPLVALGASKPTGYKAFYIASLPRGPIYPHSGLLCLRFGPYIYIKATYICAKEHYIYANDRYINAKNSLHLRQTATTNNTPRSYVPNSNGSFLTSDLRHSCCSRSL